MSISFENKVKWGILGTGWIAEQFTADLVHTVSGAGYAAGSRTMEGAERFAERFGLPKAYGSYEELVADPDVDAIYVATPHPYHHEHVLMALRAGKAVLCEKPFTVNSRELAEIIDEARSRGLFLMEAMWTRYLPVIAQVRSWLKEGRIGEVKMVKADFGFRSDWNPEGRLLNPKLGGGALLDVGIYSVSFASMVFGYAPQDVKSTALIGETGVDEQFSVLLDYGAGRTASLHGAVRLELSNDAWIIGTEGMIYIPSFFSAREATLRVAGQEEVKVTDERKSAGYALEAEEVGRCLLAGEKESPLIPLDESLGIMKLLDQIRDQWGLKYPFEV